MGTHISFVRSVSLDKWKPEEIALMQATGNLQAALSWEAKLPAEYKRPSSNDGIYLEKFIRDKYEHKRYFKPPNSDKAATPQGRKDSPPPGSGVARVTNTSQPRSGTPLPQQQRTATPFRTTEVPPRPQPQQQQQEPSLLVDYFLPQTQPSSQPVKQEPLFSSTGPSTQGSNQFPFQSQPQQQQQVPVKAETTNASPADLNLFKKSNIMSMFDVQTEQQKQQQQQALLQQQMYYAAASPQLYYTTSGGLVPVMYGAQIPAGQVYQTPYAVYPQHFLQPSSQ
jgi:stromal membrane-associated protein